MKEHFESKLKITSKRWLGRCVYSCIYIKNKIQKYMHSAQKRISPPKNRPNLVTVTAKRWKIISAVLIILLGIYYGIGGAISSRFNNKLDVPPKTNLTIGQHTLAALTYVLKAQVNDTAWTPALPIIFPASVLDNLPNFQLGVKDSANYFIKHIARNGQNEKLKEAANLLDYPANIWLFSKDQKDKISPGSAKQYRKAWANLKTILTKNENYLPLTDENFLSLLNDSILLINKKIAVLNKHILEHSSELSDFKADDFFYQTQGCLYTLHYLLSAVTKDFRQQILDNDQYENMTTVLHLLTEAMEIKPISVKNASLNNIYNANHLAYLTAYLSQAQSKLQEIYYTILLKNTEQPTCPSSEKE